MWSDDSLSGRGQCNVVSTFLYSIVASAQSASFNDPSFALASVFGLDGAQLSCFFHDRAPNMEVPTTFAHDNGQVLGASLERFFPSCGLQCTILPVPVQVISPLNEQLVVPVLEWLHRARHKTLKRCQDASFARLLSLE